MKFTKVLVLAAIAILFLEQAPAPAQSAPPLPAVSVAVIEKQPASRPLTYLGRIEALNSADVTTRTEGFIKTIHFDEGQTVLEGDPLFDLDPSVHLSAVAQAEAAVAGAEAALNLAETTYRRFESLARTSSASRAEADRALAERDVAEASLAQAKAQLEARKLDLSFTKIAAPISGRIGRTAFNTGGFVGPASGPLAAIVQLDPVRVVVPIRERDFISAVTGDGRLHLDLLGKDFSPELRLANGQKYPLRGVLDFIDNQINPRTGTVDVRARFENPDHILLPGGVADVILDAVEPPLVAVVPIAALQQDMNGFFVLAVDDQNIVEVRPVKIGMQIDQSFVITDGLREGERVIVEGLQRVGPGMAVNPLPLTPRAD